MEIKGMVTCPVCHRDFALIIENHYVAQDVGEVGLITAIKGHEEPKRYDAIDCPHCGCQTVLQERKPEYCPCDYGICDECEDCSDGPCVDSTCGYVEKRSSDCEDCKYANVDYTEYPCSICTHNYYDRYEAESEGEPKDE